MNEIKPQPGIMDIAPYKGGSSQIEGVDEVIKLSSNENPLGPSPAAKEAFRNSSEHLHRYPSDDHLTLREAIAEVHGLDAERIVCGAGSDEIIALLCQAYAGPGDDVIYTEHGFLMYRISTLAAGATPVAVPERERVADVDAILAACSADTKIVFIANPNNPTGTMIGGNELARLANGLPSQALLVLDGAYAEYVEDFDGGRELVETRKNVVMTRTFSKIYGLGGLRVGWGYAPKEVVDVLNRVRGPFNVNAAALAAAETAVRDTAYTEHCRIENNKWRAWLAAELANLGVASDRSYGNFVLARFTDREESIACDEFLKSRGLIARRVEGYGLPDALRITVGDEAACRKVIAAVADFKSERL